MPSKKEWLTFTHEGCWLVECRHCGVCCQVHLECRRCGLCCQVHFECRHCGLCCQVHLRCRVCLHGVVLDRLFFLPASFCTPLLWQGAHLLLAPSRCLQQHTRPTCWSLLTVCRCWQFQPEELWDVWDLHWREFQHPASGTRATWLHCQMTHLLSKKEKCREQYWV